jgi:micrococcal nuclease
MRDRQPGLNDVVQATPSRSGAARAVLVALAVAWLAACGGSAQSGERSTIGPQGPTEQARVVRVVDGDTIIVDRGQGDERLRYIGIDTPETVKPDTPVAWMGPEATAANRALVEGQEVVLERDVSETDQYGRLLRYVWLESDAGWLMVNEALLRRGVAQVTTYPPDVAYVDRFLQAQRAAREAGVGLWGSPPP